MASKGQLTGMRGVYLVAAELSRLGFIVSPTSRSAAGADLLVTDHDCKKAFSVQVKTNSVSFGYFQTSKRSRKIKSPSHVYVLVNLRPKAVEYYIVPSKVVARHIKKTVRPNSVWYGVPREKVRRYKDKWQLFGRPT